MAHQDEVIRAHHDNDNDYDIEKAKSGPKDSAKVSGQYDYDANYHEKPANGELRELPDLKRRLKSRHLQMIAIGKAICFEQYEEFWLITVQVVQLELVCLLALARPSPTPDPSAH